MKKILLLLIISYGFYHWYSNNNSGVPHYYGEAHNDLIMYSLTTCGYCKQKAQELRAENIAFQEYYIDQDSEKMNELNSKLADAGFKPQGYGTPIFDVRGVMLPNNPSLSSIKKYLYDD